MKQDNNLQRSLPIRLADNSCKEGDQSQYVCPLCKRLIKIKKKNQVHYSAKYSFIIFYKGKYELINAYASYTMLDLICNALEKIRPAAYYLDIWVTLTFWPLIIKCQTRACRITFASFILHLMKSISYRYLKYKNLKEYKRLLLLQDLLLNSTFSLKGLISDIKRAKEIRIEVSFLIKDVPTEEHPD